MPSGIKNKNQVSISKKAFFILFSFLRRGEKEKLSRERAKPSEHKGGQLFPKVTFKRCESEESERQNSKGHGKDRPHNYLLFNLLHESTTIYN